jgi:hypothetical protein
LKLGDPDPVIAAILFSISVVAFGQFGLYYWRAMIAATARQPVPDRVLAAAGIGASPLGAQDFRAIMMVRNLVPDLQGSGPTFRAIGIYYSALDALKRVIPAMADWAEAEMATCSRCVAVLVDQHLERNIAYAHQIKGI